MAADSKLEVLPVMLHQVPDAVARGPGHAEEGPPRHRPGQRQASNEGNPYWDLGPRALNPRNSSCGSEAPWQGEEELQKGRRLGRFPSMESVGQGRPTIWPMVKYIRITRNRADQMIRVFISFSAWAWGLRSWEQALGLGRSVITGLFHGGNHRLSGLRIGHLRAQGVGQEIDLCICHSRDAAGGFSTLAAQAAQVMPVTSNLRS